MITLRPMETDIITVREACELLEITSPEQLDNLTPAFRRAAKAAHPDSEGGDVVRFRRVIDAYHLLQQQPDIPTDIVIPAPAKLEAAVKPAPSLPPLLVITPMQSLFGGKARLTAHGKRYLVQVPTGIRAGDHVRLDNIGMVPVMIRPADGMSVLGGDLFMDHPIDHRFIRDGGRIELTTHAGPQSAWLVPDMTEPVRLCFKGLGLPARGERPAGNLFVKLEGCDDAPSAVKDMRLRFTRVWTDHSVAA